MRAGVARIGALARAAAVVLMTIPLAGGTARAGFENAGTTAANFLSLGSGARTLAMGGAILGLGGDPDGAAWNPAALGWMDGTEVVLSHAGLQDGSLQESGAIGGRIGHSPSRWAVSGLYQGDRSLDGRDAAGASTGSFAVSSMALGAALAQKFGSRASLGVTAKAVREDIANVSGSGVTFDAGLMVRAGRFGLGAAAQNLGGRMAYGASSHPFPTSYGVGLGFSHPTANLRFALDANFPSAYHPDLRAGAEWLHRGVIALRAGYRKELGSIEDPLDGPSFGLGVSHRGMWLDYGYLLSNGGGGQHRMGLRLRLAGSAAGVGAVGQASGPAKPEPSGEFDWARDGARLGPGKPSKP